MQKTTSLLAALCLIQLCGCSTQGSTSPQDTAPAEKAARDTTAAADTHPIVFMGDSITAFWSKQYPGAPAPPVPSLKDLVPDAVNAGNPGETSAQMLARFQADVLALNPRVVVILAGTNDVQEGLDLPTAVNNVSEMAQEAAAAGVYVVLATIPPTANYPQFSDQVIAFNRQLSVMAAAFDYPVVDYYAALLDSGGQPNLADFNLGDLHPDALGYAAMWVALDASLPQGRIVIPRHGFGPCTRTSGC